MSLRTIHTPRSVHTSISTVAQDSWVCLSFSPNKLLNSKHRLIRSNNHLSNALATKCLTVDESLASDAR